MTEKKKNILIVFTSILISLIIIETILSIKSLFKVKERLTSEPGYMLYEQGKVFKNVDKIFKYEPNRKILTKAFFYIDDEFKEAYSYEIKTNNFGLVQRNDIDKNSPSILFLGDSFTEGQGEDSWVNKFNGSFQKYQIINGGILATGPQQFELMEKHISEFYKVKKVVILYIGHDIRRSPFNFSKQELNCLENYQNCNGNEIFFGYPINSKNPNTFLKELREKRIQNYKSLPLDKRLKKRIKFFFSNIHVIKIPHTFLREKFYKTKNIKIKKNLEAMKRLHDKYGENIYFINLKTRDEILNGKEYETNFAMQNIMKFSNNYFTCEFDNNLELYDELHNHPNSRGYDYLFDCVSKIMADKIN